MLKQNSDKMATINFSVKTNKNPSKIYVRFINGRAIDITACIDVFVNPSNWDQKNQRIREVNITPDKFEINKRLMLLKVHIFDTFNLAYTNGEIIDKYWLQGITNTFFNRPNQEKKKRNENHTIYYTDFADWWIKEKAKEWLVGPNRYLNDREIGKNKAFIGLVKDFEGKNKIKLIDITNKKIAEFVDFLSNNNYASSTIKRHITRFKFFCLRAEGENFSINKMFKQKVYAPESEEIKDPYLNPNEIETIFKHDFGYSDEFDNARDNLIIACWTGLRVSDFLRLDTSNFIDDFIEIKTQKNKANVVIPVHPNVKSILIKRKGQLPKQVSDSEFNKVIKKVCRAVGIKNKIKGKLYDKTKRRNVVGIYEKHLLISSHIGRRSFATNLFGKIPNSVIMAVGGWKTERIMLDYIKKSNKDHAVELKKYWEGIYN